MSTPGPLTAAPQALPPTSPLPPAFQPAKYFTLIFFGLSLLICGLMALYITIQICRRRRLRRQVDEEGVGRVLERQSVHASPPLREIPLKEGFMVSHPNGEMEVAYEVNKPDPEREDAGAKEQPSTAASQSLDSPRSHSGTDTGLSRHSSQQLQRSSSLQEPRSESSQRRLDIETQEEEDRRRRALYIWSL